MKQEEAEAVSAVEIPDETKELQQNEGLRFSDFFDTTCGSGDDTAKPKACTKCDKSFTTNGVLEMHWQKVHETKPLLRCVDCKTDFKRKMALIAHYRTAPVHRLPGCVGDKLMGCDICDAFNIVSGFRNDEELLRHTKKVHGEDTIVNATTQSKFVCPFPSCIGEFAYRKGMIEHIQILHCDHLISFLLGVDGPDKERLLEGMHYKCNYCSKVYRVTQSLRQHLSDRHGDHKGLNSPLKSPVKKPFNFIRKTPTKTTLASTTAVTTAVGEDDDDGDKTFVAKVTKTLPESVSRTRPVRTTASVKRSRQASTSPTPPPKKVRKDEDKVETDVSQSPGENTFSCPKCKKTFSRSSVLNVHIQMVHGHDGSPSKGSVGTSSPQKAAVTSPTKTQADSAKTPAGTKQASPSKTNGKSTRDLEAIFNSETFKNKNNNVSAAKDFYGEENLLKPEDLEEDCIVEGCSRKFLTYFSMMRHVAFHHNPVLTAKLMKIA